MPTFSVEGLFLTFILFLVAGMASARPRRRFCENYPFAPRCLGVAAKREAVQPSSQSDLNLNQLVEQLLSSRTEDSEGLDNWPHNDNKDVLVPYNVLTKLIREKMSASHRNQNQNSDYWDEFDETSE